ncbi:MAG: nickel-responsive transcriptional regulator NikR [Spirochaetales bacterium]|nr:nickel-responsive transcriptional regulator NikR [Spirochaetales bacterium]
MAKLVRFGVSIEEGLLTAFDTLIEAKGWANRSDALRGLIRELLLEVQVEEDPEGEVVGTITLVYDHHHRDLANRLVDLQHRHHLNIVSTLHVHIDEANCLEVLVVKGPNREVRRISDALIGTRGVEHGKLIIHRGTGGLGAPTAGRDHQGAGSGRGGEGPHGHPHEHDHPHEHPGRRSQDQADHRPHHERAGGDSSVGPAGA